LPVLSLPSQGGQILSCGNPPTVTIFDPLKSWLGLKIQQVKIPIGSAQFLSNVNGQRATRQVSG
jgi:hypothetical protein